MWCGTCDKGHFLRTWLKCPTYSEIELEEGSEQHVYMLGERPYFLLALQVRNNYLEWEPGGVSSSFPDSNLSLVKIKITSPEGTYILQDSWPKKWMFSQSILLKGRIEIGTKSGLSKTIRKWGIRVFSTCILCKIWGWKWDPFHGVSLETQSLEMPPW